MSERRLLPRKARYEAEARIIQLNSVTPKKKTFGLLRKATKRTSTRKVSFSSDDDFITDTSDEDDDEDDSFTTPPPTISLTRSAKKRTGVHKSQSVCALTKNMQSLNIAKFSTPGSCVPKRSPIPIKDNQHENVTTGENNLSLARKKLHVAAVPSTLPCRDAEFDNIYCFVELKLRTRSSGCMYISGLPGSGKTATVHEVIRTIQQADDIIPFHFIEVNGMRVTEPRQIFVEIYKSLTGKKLAPKYAKENLDKEFKKSIKTKKPCVLLVDEMDLLTTPKQDVLYHLFDWPQRSHGLIILAIANTMDLPERLLPQRVASRMGFARLPFQPYSHKQLTEIVHSRLEGMAVFEPKAIELCAKKVGAVSGDARRALDICRRAVELASLPVEEDFHLTRAKSNILKDKNKMEEENDMVLEEGVTMVTIHHIDAAIKEMFSNNRIAAIRACSVYERLLLRAILTEVQRTGVEEVRVEKVLPHFLSVTSIEGLPKLGESRVFDLIASLGSSRLIVAEPGWLDIKMQLRLNCNQQDVLLALKDDKYSVD